MSFNRAPARGHLSLTSGEDQVILSIQGSTCDVGTANRFFGTYVVTDGVGVYALLGTGRGNVTYEQSASGAFTVSAFGAFYSRTARQDGEG